MKCDTRFESRREGRNFGPLVATLYLLIASASIVHAAESLRRPNIVILFADDMNYAGPSCYGGRWGLETPHSDRLANEGVRCTNAYVSAPTCGLTRAGLTTGRHQCRFGHELNSPRQEGIGLPLAEATIGDPLRVLGYRTGLIGKWHLGGDRTCGADYHPLQRGFDEFFGFYGSMVWFYRSNHIFRGTEQIKDLGYLRIWSDGAVVDDRMGAERGGRRVEHGMQSVVYQTVDRFVNIWLSLLQRAGVETDHFADSKGTLL